MSLVVRTWNLFHGNAVPPRRRGYLREMIELVTDDRPGVLCLQELPVWALPSLGSWSAMQSFAAVARRPLVRGPGPAWITRLHQGRIRSAFVGQANAILVSTALQADDLGHHRISRHGRERRVVHGVRIPGFVVANLHASHARYTRHAVEAEIQRARAFAESFSRPDEGVVLAGDFNLADVRLVGYSEPASGVDHVLVRGATAHPPVVWSSEHRTRNNVLLSDHPPVEVTIE